VRAAILLIITGLAQAADPPSGQDIFERRCSGCHAIDRDRTGPQLRGVYGKAAASSPTFPYSDALKKAHLTWDAATLDKWLTDPEIFLPGNDMATRVEKAAERAAIIDYLKKLPAK
jgi:cytochrome c